MIHFGPGYAVVRFWKVVILITIGGKVAVTETKPSGERTVISNG